jgi:hypothetical protein
MDVTAGTRAQDEVLLQDTAVNVGSKERDVSGLSGVFWNAWWPRGIFHSVRRLLRRLCSVLRSRPRA